MLQVPGNPHCFPQDCALIFRHRPVVFVWQMRLEPFGSRLAEVVKAAGGAFAQVFFTTLMLQAALGIGRRALGRSPTDNDRRSAIRRAVRATIRDQNARKRDHHTNVPG